MSHEKNGSVSGVGTTPFMGPKILIEIYIDGAVLTFYCGILLRLPCGENQKYPYPCYDPCTQHHSNQGVMIQTLPPVSQPITREDS